MSRVRLPKGQQKKYLIRVAKCLNFNWARVAKISGVCERTIRDWRREKYNISHEALLRLGSASKVEIPKVVKILPEYWGAKKFSRIGGLKRYKLYGDFGTSEGRRKGGVATQKLFRSDPAYAKRLGVNIKKEIKKPGLTTQLAELIGIILGDGGISDYQVTLTFNKETDKEYSIYARRLIEKLFSISSSVMVRPSYNVRVIVVSSKSLVEFLESKGLKRGNKVKNKVNIPEWILNNRNYRISCLRGLLDTDGSFYSYKHSVFNKKYCNSALCFTNYSRPLLKSAQNILRDLGFTPIMSSKRLYLHKRDEINRYFKEIGTHNPKHLKRYRDYLSSCNLAA